MVYEMTTISDGSTWGVSCLPFQVGNGYCLGEKEVGLVDHIRHIDWSVFHGSAVPYDGLSWRAYANTKWNKVNHNNRIRTQNTWLTLLLPRQLGDMILEARITSRWRGVWRMPTGKRILKLLAGHWQLCKMRYIPIQLWLWVFTCIKCHWVVMTVKAIAICVLHTTTLGIC